MTGSLETFRDSHIFPTPNGQVAEALCVDAAESGITPNVAGLLFDESDRLVLLLHTSGFPMIPEVSVRFLNKSTVPAAEFIGDRYNERHGLKVGGARVLALASNPHTQIANNGEQVTTRIFAVEANCPNPPERSTSGLEVITMDPWKLRDHYRETEHQTVLRDKPVPNRLRLARELVETALPLIYREN